VTVIYVLDRFTWPGALPVYIGDDKDEVTFAAIKARHGLALVAAAAISVTLERYNAVDFSNLYYISTDAVFLRKCRTCRVYRW
jgi:hypothetical protein